MILEQLMEKKDLFIYIDMRVKQLNEQKLKTMKETPDKKKEAMWLKFNGRISELINLKQLIKKNELKSKSKYLWKKYNIPTLMKGGIIIDPELAHKLEMEQKDQGCRMTIPKEYIQKISKESMEYLPLVGTIKEIRDKEQQSIHETTVEDILLKKMEKDNQKDWNNKMTDPKNWIESYTMHIEKGKPTKEEIKIKKTCDNCGWYDNNYGCNNVDYGCDENYSGWQPIKKDISQLNEEIANIYQYTCQPCMLSLLFRAGDCVKCKTMDEFTKIQEQKKEIKK